MAHADYIKYKLERNITAIQLVNKNGQEKEINRTNT